MNRVSQTVFGALFIVMLLTGITGALWAMPEREAAESTALAAIQGAAELYDQGNYALAAQAYGQLIDQGYTNVELFYNQGLAYYAAGDLTQAHASLKMAAAQAPRNLQVRTALAEVELAMPSETVTARSDVSAQILAAGERWLTADELALLVLGLWILLATGVLLVLFRRSTRTASAPASQNTAAAIH